MAMTNSDLFDDEVTDDSASSSGQSAEVYVVEKILRRRFNVTENTFEYELKWKGYPDSENTWEPESSLKCDLLLQKFNEERQQKREKKLEREKHKGQVLTEAGEKFVINDNEFLDQSSSNSCSSDGGIRTSLKKRKLISSASKRRSKDMRSGQSKVRHVKKEESPVPESSKSKSRSQGRKKKLGKILSYDNIPAPPMPDEHESINSVPSTPVPVQRKGVKKEVVSETPIQKGKKPKLESRQIKKEQLSHLYTSPQRQFTELSSKGMSGEMRNKESRFICESTLSKTEYCNMDHPRQKEKVIGSIATEEVVGSIATEEEEEESDTNFELDMKRIPFKIIDEGEENGFDRGWEVDRILALISDDDQKAENAKARKYAIVKFKGFKYSHKILLSEVKTRAPKQLSTFLSEKMSMQLQARSQKRSDWHKSKG